MTTRPGYIKDSLGNWIQIGPAVPVGSTVYYQASEPSTPATGDIWIDSDDDVPSVDSTLFYRWTKTMSGGETSLSGTDDNSLTLKYTPGYEELFINGVLQVRGSDYVATTGTSITGLTALSAGDVVMIQSTIAYSVGDTYTQATLDGKFSPITTTGLVLLNTTSFTAQASVAIDNCFSSTYDNYFMTVQYTAATGSDVGVIMYFRSGTPATDTTTNYSSQRITQASTTIAGSATTTGRIGVVDSAYPTFAQQSVDIRTPFKSVVTNYNSRATFKDSANTDIQILIGGYQNSTTAFTGIKVLPGSGTFTGTIKVYGYK
jgi:hypothetical protein